jgi:hypothetical protein
MAIHCDFDNKSQQIRDKLVVGLRDRTVSKELQLKADLTLEDATTFARQSEAVKSQLSEQMPSKSVNEVKKDSRGRHSGSYRGRGRGRGRGSSRGQRGGQTKHSSDYKSSADAEIQCRYCDRKHVRDRNVCPAKQAKCHKCHERGHFAKCCPQSQSKKQVREVVVPDCQGDGMNDYYDEYFDVMSVSAGHTKPWELNLKVCERNVKFKLDSGADVCVLSENTYRSMPIVPKLKECALKLKSVNGDLRCLGTFVTKVRHKKTIYVLKFYVVAGATNNLLSRAACTSMGLLQVHLDEAQVQDSALFGDLGNMKCTPVKIN